MPLHDFDFLRDPMRRGEQGKIKVAEFRKFTPFTHCAQYAVRFNASTRLLTLLRTSGKRESYFRYCSSLRPNPIHWSPEEINEPRLTPKLLLQLSRMAFSVCPNSLDWALNSLSDPA